MQQKNSDKQTDIVTGVFGGMKIDLCLKGDAVNVAIVAADLNLLDIDIEIREILPDDTKREVYFGKLFPFIKFHLSKQERLRCDLLSTSLITLFRQKVTQTVALSNEVLIPLSIKFPTPWAGKFEIVLDTKTPFLSAINDNSYIDVQLESTDEIAFARTSILSIPMNTGNSIMDKDLGDNVSQVAYITKALTVYRSSINPIDKAVFTCNDFSYSYNAFQLASLSILDSKIPVNPAQGDTMSNDILIHSGEIVSGVKLHLDLIGANIQADDRIMYMTHSQLSDATIRQIASFQGKTID